MFLRYLVINLAIVVMVGGAVGAKAQTGQLRGHVNIKQADGTTVPASEAVIDVYRTDLQGNYHTKTDKKGGFVFAGLPYVGTYIVAASHPSAAPSWLPDVKAGREIDYEISLTPGDGKKLTLDQIKAAMAGAKSSGSTGSSPAKGESAEDKAKREEILRKNAEITEKNKKIEESNTIVARTFKSGNEALLAKNHDEAKTLRRWEIGKNKNGEARSENHVGIYDSPPLFSACGHPRAPALLSIPLGSPHAEDEMDHRIDGHANADIGGRC